jgi:hypothetical protein
MKKQRSFWPIGILLAFLLFTGGIATCVVVACTHKSELVSDQYYDQEIKYQARIDSLERTKRLATPANAIYEPATRHLIVSLPTEHAGKAVTGEIELYRPSAAGLDRRFKLEPDTRGLQLLDASRLPEGVWKVRVTWTVDGLEYFLDQKVILGAAKPPPSPSSQMKRREAKDAEKTRKQNSGEPPHMD